MATRGRPRKNPVESKEVNHEIHSLTHQISLLEIDLKNLKILNEELSLTNAQLLETISRKSNFIEEQESIFSTLDDENEHLKEIIKSLAEVL